MTDIVERLRDPSWTEVPTQLMLDAADEIERLRSLCGKAEVGQSFAEITGDLERRSTEPPEAT